MYVPIIQLNYKLNSISNFKKIILQFRRIQCQDLIPKKTDNIVFGLYSSMHFKINFIRSKKISRIEIIVKY